MTNIEFINSKRRLWSDIILLLGTQYAAYVFPLITLPYLARVLGPAAWGRVVAAQALSFFCFLCVDFGFSLVGVREMAISLDNLEVVLQHMRAIFGVKIIFSILALMVIPVSWFFLRIFACHFRIVIYAVIAGILQGWNLSWVFQGLAQLKLAAVFDFLARSIGMLSVFFFVHHASQAWIVLLLQAGGYGFSLIILLVILSRRFPYLLPDMTNMLHYIKLGFPMFCYGITAFLYTMANPILLSIWGTTVMVGQYAGPDRISAAGGRLLMPVTRALVPRNSYTIHNSPGNMRYQFYSGFFLMFCGGVLISLLFYFLSHDMVRIILGSQYADSYGIMRILSFVPLFVSLSSFAGLQWLVPLGREYYLLTITMGAGCLNLLLSPILVHRWGAVGMAISSLSSEIFVAIGLFAVIYFLINSRKIKFAV